jgi:hypothetical protein
VLGWVVRVVESLGPIIEALVGGKEGNNKNTNPCVVPAIYYTSFCTFGVS